MNLYDVSANFNNLGETFGKQLDFYLRNNVYCQYIRVKIEDK